MKEIKFYTTQWCGDCVRSKALLNKLNVTFEEIDIDVNKKHMNLLEIYKMLNLGFLLSYLMMALIWLNQQI